MVDEASVDGVEDALFLLVAQQRTLIYSPTHPAAAAAAAASSFSAAGWGKWRISGFLFVLLHAGETFLASPAVLEPLLLVLLRRATLRSHHGFAYQVGCLFRCLTAPYVAKHSSTFELLKRMPRAGNFLQGSLRPGYRQRCCMAAKEAPLQPSTTVRTPCWPFRTWSAWEKEEGKNPRKVGLITIDEHSPIGFFPATCDILFITNK